MHQIKIFERSFTRPSPLQNLQDDVNEWFEEVKKRTAALFVHHTNLTVTDHSIIYIVYYTYIPNEPKQPQTHSPAPDGSGTR